MTSRVRRLIAGAGALMCASAVLSGAPMTAQAALPSVPLPTVEGPIPSAVPGDRRKGVTPIQAYREGLRVIRGTVGGDFVLGCGAPLLPSALNPTWTRSA